MRPHTPKTNASQQQGSSSFNGISQTNYESSIPRVRSTIANARAANSQPTFDFLSGESPQSNRESRIGERFTKSATHDPIVQSNWHSLSFENEEERQRHKREVDDLNAENKALRYSIDNYKQELELTKLRNEGEIRDITRRAEDDFKKSQVADTERIKAIRQLEASLKEITGIRETTEQERISSERKLREAIEDKRVLEEKFQDLKTEYEDGTRSLERKLAELESRNESLQQRAMDLQQNYDTKSTELQETQEKLSIKESFCGAQESEILRLKTITSDNDTLGIVKRGLTEQVSHIKKLEHDNRELLEELGHFKKIHKSVEIVEEEKRSLQRKLEAKEEIELELNEARIQRQMLQDEQLAWKAYLKNQAGPDGVVEFDSPEAVVRALVEERLQTALLIERIGSMSQEIILKESINKDLIRERETLVKELEKLKTTKEDKSIVKAQLRLERQKALAIKETEYLRAQLKTYDSEDFTFQPDSVDEAKVKRISQLEDLVEKYRVELQNLHEELCLQNNKTQEILGNKRKCEYSEDSDRQDQLIRKLRNLQDEFDNLQSSKVLLEKDLSVTKERLEAVSLKNKTRILSLRSNPTSDYEAIKQTTLTTLKQENSDLLTQLQGSGASKDCVPSSSLAAAQLEIAAAQQAFASEKKRNDRLIKVWGAKSTEFRQMVISLLGWDVVFMRDGKTRMTSYFYPSKDDDENSIVFDGEKGTMKICGGPESAFAIKISDQVRFWCKERGSIPCFLAALTLEFWEEMNGDRTLRVAL